MKGYKAFGKGMICKGKQYSENTVFEEEKAEICESGMHFYKKPLDVLNYYPLVNENGEITEFAEVESLDECNTNDNVKYCTKKLKIGAKISFAKLVEASVNFDKEVPTETKVKTSTKIGSSGDGAKIGSSGDCAKINSNGKHAVICCAGKESIAKGKIGSWITLSEWKYSEQEKMYIPVCVKTEKIDGESIKEDVFYKLENGEFIEVCPA